jgi:hypothetical protein
MQTVKSSATGSDELQERGSEGCERGGELRNEGLKDDVRLEGEFYGER